MSTRKTIVYRRPDGADHSSDSTPKIGDKFTRGDEEWVVTGVEHDSRGRLLVTLTPLQGDGKVQPSG